jgi:4-alpha-glucanotransferase
MEALAERAAAWGVDPEFVDARGVLRHVDAETVRRVIDVVSAGEAPPSPRLLPPAIVARRGRTEPIAIRELPSDAACRWTVFSGVRRMAEGMDRNGTCRLPDDLPLGEYRLDLEVESPDGRLHETSTLIVAPERAFGADGADRRLWALAVQLYGVRSERNWGHGDFTDVCNLLELAAAIGAAGIGLNPLHALFPDAPERSSPYSPNSRIFLNPLYIDVDAVPEFPGLGPAGLTEAVVRLRETALVDYKGVGALKLAALRQSFAKFRDRSSPERARDFETFRREHGEALARFASFEVLRQKFGPGWRDWPPEWREPDMRALARLRQCHSEEIEFQEFVQWIADRQLRGCRDKARKLKLPLGLYLDIAVGVDPNGADAWSEASAMLTNVTVGAPPDMLNTAGQNWGIVSFNPRALERHGFGAFRRMLRAAMRYAGAVRIDHVLGLYRLYLIPQGARAGTYVRCPVDALLAIVALESLARRCIVIGEDLGTVPGDLRGRLADWGVWSYRVLLFERERNGAFRLPQHYAQNAVVTFSTHDLPTFAGWRSGHDLREKHGVGIDPGETDAERTEAQAALRHALAAHQGETSDLSSFLAVARYLAATPAKLLIVSIEDALGVLEQANVPGTTDERPNWQHRVPVAVEHLNSHSQLRGLAEVLAANGRAVRKGLRRRRAKK